MEEAEPLVEVLDAIAALVESVNPSYVAAISRLASDGLGFSEVVGGRLSPRMRAVEERTAIDMRSGSAGDWHCIPGSTPGS